MSFEVQVPTLQAMADRVGEGLRMHPWLVAERGDAVVGYAYGSVHRARAAYRWSVEVSVYVAAGAQRQGIGRLLYERLLAVVRLQGFHMAYAGITLPNPRSVALHESVGFTPVGVFPHAGHKHGTWHDVGWWYLALNAEADHPADPTPLAAIPDLTLADFTRCE